MTDDLDRRLRELARAARRESDMLPDDVERVLDEVTSGAPVARLRPVTSVPERRRWIAVAGAAAAVALFAGGAVWLLATDDQVRTADPAVTAPAGPTEPVDGVTVAPTGPPGTRTTPTSSPTEQSTPPTAPSTAPTSASGPPVTQATPAFQLDLTGMQAEASRIVRSCSEVATPWGPTTQCTQLVVGPTGIPVTYDPASRTLTRHVREDGEYVSAVLPEALGASPSLIAVGPDDVAYFNVVAQPGAEGSADLVAVSLAPGDAGREIAREVGRGNPGFDSDFVVVPEGIASIGWYDDGPRPPVDVPIVMPWVDRDPADDDSPAPQADDYPNGVRRVRIDAYGSTVSVEGHTWALTGTAAEIQPTGMPVIVATFDGGFLARYDEVAGDYRQVIVRGFGDGTVEEWVLPPAPSGQSHLAIPEPQGTVLIGEGDRFVRVAPFAERPNGWDGRLDVDATAGTATPVGLGELLAGLDWSQAQPPWDRGYIAFANAVAGAVGPGELRTIQVLRSDTAGGMVAVVTEGYLDDSVYGTRLDVSITPDRSVASITWSNTCQPNRGHQDYRAALCL